MGQVKSGFASKRQFAAEQEIGPCSRTGFDGGATCPIPPQIDDRNARLWEVIECEIIPRLMLVHDFYETRNNLEDSDLIDVPDFTALVMTEDETAVLSHIDELRSRGLSPERICIELLAPTVDRLSILLDEHCLYGGHIGVGLAHVDAALARLGRRQLS
jgi:hypothetical protein